MVLDGDTVVLERRGPQVEEKVWTCQATRELKEMLISYRS